MAINEESLANKALLADEHKAAVRASDANNLTENTSPGDLSQEQVTDPTIQRRLQLAAQKRQSQAAQDGFRIPMTPKEEPVVSEEVLSSPARLIPGGHSAPQLAGLYKGDPNGMTAISADEAHGTNVTQKAKDLAMTAAQAQMVGDAVASNALINTTESVRRSDERVNANNKLLADKGKKLADLEAESKRLYNEPSKFFDPIKGTSTGFLGFLAKLSWALSTPEYQQNTIAAANSMADQDYKAKMAKRANMDGRIRAANDSLAFWERRTGDQYTAEQMFKIDARQRLIDSVKSVGLLANNPVIKSRTELTVAELEKQNEEARQKLYASTYHAPRMVGGGPPLVRDKSGKVTGLKGVTKSGRVVRTSAADLATTPHFKVSVNGRQRLMRANSDVEASKMSDFSRNSRGAISGLDKATNLLKQARGAKNRGEREEMLRAAARFIQPAYGAWLQATSRGAPTGMENNQALEAITGGFEASKGPFGRAQKWAEDIAKGTADLNDPKVIEQFEGAIQDNRAIINDSVMNAFYQYDEMQVEEAIDPASGYRTKVVVDRQDDPKDRLGPESSSAGDDSEVK